MTLRRVLLLVMLFTAFVTGGCGNGGSSPAVQRPPVSSQDPKPVEYTVTFDSNGGSPVASIKVISGGTIEMPESPTREGYVFSGWYKDFEFKEIFSFGSNGDKVTSDITLYARWIEDVHSENNTNPTPRSTITALSLEESSIGDIEVNRNESGDITDIEGQYVSFDILNSDDALVAVAVLREELGIENPYEELEVSLEHSHSSGSEYSFQQVHKGVKVFGARLMVSANSKGKGNFLHSSLLSSDIVSKADGKTDIGKSSAEDIVKNEYVDGIEIDSASTERVIFGTYEPFYAYIVRAYGVSGDQYVDENVFVNAQTSEVIGTLSNIHYADIENAHGKNEISEEELTFPVEHRAGKYVLRDPDLNVQIYESKMLAFSSEIESDTNYFSDREQVSAYTNMQEILRWWKASFDRDSLDGKGGEVKVVLHAYWPGMEDDAAWSDSLKSISVYSKVDRKYSAGADIGWLTHETQHGVMYYIVGSLSNLGIAGAIHEGYADVFACIKNRHWKFGDVLYEGTKAPDGTEIYCNRNAADPFDINSYRGWLLSKGQITTKEMYVLGLRAVANAAYQMHESNPSVENGLTWDELGQVWYNAMYKGLWSGMLTSNTYIKGNLFTQVTFDDVRRCVVNAAKELADNGELSGSKIAVIEQVFDTIGKNVDDTYTVDKTENFSGTITDSKTNASLPGVNVKVFKKVSHPLTQVEYLKLQTSKTLPTDTFSMKLDKGEYKVMFTKEGYESLTLSVTIENQNVGLTVALEPEVVDTPEVPENPENPEGTEVPIDEAHFPDPTFRGYVRLFDRNSDGVLSESEISSVTEISLYNDSGMAGNNVYTYQKGVLYSLQGVEYFTALKTLYCIYNSLTALDVSKNAALETLYCYGNQLTELDVSKNAALKKLWCNENKLTKLNVSGLSQLEELSCYKNQLTVLDLSGCTSLVTLECYENQLIALDVSSCRALTNLSCSNNQLTTLNVNNCAALRILTCSDNKLTTLNLSGCPSLTMLTCDKNQLKALDLSNCPQLKSYSSVSCDSGVTITWPSTTTSTTASRTANISSSNVLAILPAFTPSKSGTYTFKASLNREKPEGSTLILLSNSEDIKGSFSESGMNVEVSADLSEGRTYNPVIVAQEDGEDREEQGGGCNVGILGTLAMMVGFSGLLCYNLGKKKFNDDRELRHLDCVYL